MIWTLRSAGGLIAAGLRRSSCDRERGETTTKNGRTRRGMEGGFVGLRVFVVDRAWVICGAWDAAVRRAAVDGRMG
jgi:hypothetical protein